MRQLDLKNCIGICESEEAAIIRLQHLTERTTTNELNARTQSSNIACNFCGNGKRIVLLVERHVPVA